MCDWKHIARVIRVRLALPLENMILPNGDEDARQNSAVKAVQDKLTASAAFALSSHKP